MTYLQRFKPTDDDFEACTHVVNDRPIIGVNAKNNKARVLAIRGRLRKRKIKHAKPVAAAVAA